MTHQGRRAGAPVRILISVLFLAFALLSPVHGAYIGMGNVVPGAGLIHKPVVSIREWKYRNLVPQHTDFSCGAAALATILKYAYGQDVSENEVLEGLFKVSDPRIVREKGFSLLDIKRYVEARGMNARGYKIEPFKLDEVKVPTIVLLDIKGYKHFVVMKKSVGAYVYIADPALGNKIMDRDEFLSSWNNVIFAVIGRGFDKQTVLLRPDKPLTARGLFDIAAPISNAELLDFGFTHADLF